MKTTQNDYSFASKWSAEIGKWGYAPVPHLLISHQRELDITNAEMVVLINLISYMWTNKDPYPAAASLGKRIGMATQTVRTNIRNLEAKGLLRRKYRTAVTNEYDLSPLKIRLQSFAQAQPPPVQKRAPLLPKTDSAPYPKNDTKEDPFAKKNKVKRSQNSTKTAHIADILDKRYGKTIGTNR